AEAHASRSRPVRSRPCGRAGRPMLRPSPPSCPRKLTAREHFNPMSPLDYLLSVIRDSQNELHVRLHAAAKAAPYVHPRLSSVALAPLWPPAHRDAAAPREYPTLINVSSAINVSSPGTVLTRAHASTIAQTAKQRLTKSAMRRGLNSRLRLAPAGRCQSA